MTGFSNMVGGGWVHVLGVLRSNLVIIILRGLTRLKAPSF